jgi:protein FAM32A
LLDLSIEQEILFMSSAYSFTGGSLRLKGDSSSSIQGGKVSKKHKHKSKSKSSSIVEAPSTKMQHVTSTVSNNSTDQHGPSGSGSSRRDFRTPAEIAYEKSMAKRADEKVLQKAAKSHKEQVEELNSYLDKLTEYNDIPKVSWTK